MFYMIFYIHTMLNMLKQYNTSNIDIYNMNSSCSTWNPDLDSVNNLNASVVLWERNDYLIDCAIGCDRARSCRSFFHNPTNETCLASSSYKRGLPTDKAGQQGWNYYTKKQYCDQGYSFNQTLGLCYKLYSISKDCDNAMISCEADGAKLLTIRNEAEYSFIYDVMMKGSAPSICIGLRAIGANREWMSWNSQAASYFKWDIYQPDNYLGKENCVEMFAYGYNDFDCNLAKYFICQRFI
ncbi:hypothetical protein ACJMK2_000542 [Sinanodonta woodiana]|uniref:C-type lectin domain-containing protein n=1 Tax=Sinanodonta woodiana TaxID=1069815 RepID=A0ABD3XR58_SINWO